jgi:hypothetical protein
MASTVDSRRVEPPQTNRLHGKVRREVLYHLAQPCFPGCGHLDGIVNLLQHHHRDTDRTPTPISAASDLLRPRRPRTHVRGEPVVLFDTFPLSIASCVAGAVEFFRSSPRRQSPFVVAVVVVVNR